MTESTESKVSFGKVFWPSLVAIMIASIAGLVFFFLILGGIIGAFSDFGPEPLALKEKTILHMQLKGSILEKADADFDPTTFTISKSIGLPDILYGLNKAKEDKNIKGLFIDVSDVDCGMATAREIRNALKDFQKSGKFVVAYNSGEYISQKAYYISSAAKEAFGFPTSAFQLTGLGGEMMYYKGMLDKLDLEVEIIRGKNNDFKSAVEPFFRTSMSDSSRVQVKRYITSIWEDMCNDIALDRKIKTQDLNLIADELKITRAEDAVSFGLLDGVKYRDEMMEYLMKKVSEKSEDKLEFQDFEKYATSTFYDDQAITKNQYPSIAVILAEGEVSTDGDGLSSIEICKLFKKVRNEKSIKTVVFRINSPGGSALASEEIWREVALTNKVKKVTVSMGDVAASGGYYIACPAYKIFAESTTITGSIGVFGMIPYTGKMLQNKLGITFDQVSTNKHSVLSTNRKLSPEELAITQAEVDQIYDQFLKRVADGRKMTKEEVNVIARGRVWTGRDALRIGLVDQLGGLPDAIAFATNNAKLKNPKVIYYPFKEDDSFSQLIELIEEETENDVRIKSNAMPKEFIEYYEKLKKIEGMSGIQMRLPYDLTIK
ncbi:MAG: signal peptide peptidase SppA [Flavobacteriia bacterium]|nr:signal peptide peptidase SppA [Flavobacteriia bacterium]